MERARSTNIHRRHGSASQKHFSSGKFGFLRKCVYFCTENVKTLRNNNSKGLFGKHILRKQDSGIAERLSDVGVLIF